MNPVKILADLTALLLLGRPAIALSSASDAVRSIVQPIALKLAVTAVGLSLIGLELWWFLGKKRRPPGDDA